MVGSGTQNYDEENTKQRSVCESKAVDESGFRGIGCGMCEYQQKFGSTFGFHRVYILPQRDVKFRAYVFFKTARDVIDSASNGARLAIENAVYNELEFAGAEEAKI